MISLIWAMDANGGIGKNNGLPWHIGEDLQHFKQTTLHSPVVMGRKTFESIGRPLPHRENYVITRQKDVEFEGVTILHSVDEWLSIVSEQDSRVKWFCIGGAHLFEQVLPFADELVVTHIDAVFSCDTFFSPINDGEWKIENERQGTKCTEVGVSYKFVTYKRIKSS
ncbi:dihydrofolate reductase [Bacillus fonticola]|uniref:dihydrofolate reductase n=1 Tax=Bacillus fonticola TaxID=2728853 RepID=UPI00147380CA|nr:dihydrofolate reductase [Bacillus fonticola]